MSVLVIDAAVGSRGDQYNPNKFKIGKHCYGKIVVNGHHLLDEFIMGNFCSIGPKVETVVKGWHHNLEWATTYPFAAFPEKWKNVKKIEHIGKTKRYINIGSDVWIGRNAMIIGDVTIGDGAIIGANAVVSKDIPPYSVAVGNSIKVIKKRFSDKDIDFLLELKWWNWPDETIDKYLHIINSKDIEELKKLKL
jgi:virginiamycin A acetyltransferase